MRAASRRYRAASSAGEGGGADPVEELGGALQRLGADGRVVDVGADPRQRRRHRPLRGPGRSAHAAEHVAHLASRVSRGRRRPMQVQPPLSAGRARPGSEVGRRGHAHHPCRTSRHRVFAMSLVLRFVAVAGVRPSAAIDQEAVDPCEALVVAAAALAPGEIGACQGAFVASSRCRLDEEAQGARALRPAREVSEEPWTVGATRSSDAARGSQCRSPPSTERSTRCSGAAREGSRSDVRGARDRLCRGARSASHSWRGGEDGDTRRAGTAGPRPWSARRTPPRPAPRRAASGSGPTTAPENGPATVPRRGSPRPPAAPELPQGRLEPVVRDPALEEAQANGRVLEPVVRDPDRAAPPWAAVAPSEAV